MISVGIFSFWLSGCDNNLPIFEPSINSISGYPTNELNYPDITNETGFGYPITNDETPDTFKSFPNTLEIPLPNDSSGIVTGKLIIESTNEPFLAPALYLGKIISINDANGIRTPVLLGISTDTDPKASQAKDGVFLFLSVEPGEYNLFIWSPMNLFPVDYYSTSEGRNGIIVKPGELTDLGTIIIP